MIRRIAAILIGGAILIAISLLVDGAATAIYHLNGMGNADVDHPHIALAAGGIVVFAVGTLLGGIAGAYTGMRIGRWMGCVWIIAVLGAADAFSAAGMFANFGAVFVPSVVTMAIGCWLGARLSMQGAAKLSG
jgi:hypothetical protein